MPEGANVKQPTAENFKLFPDRWFETVLAAFGRYLPEAPAKGAMRLPPPTLVVNTKGLEGIQGAVDLMRIVSEKGWGEIKEVIDRIIQGMEEDKISPIKLVVKRP